MLSLRTNQVPVGVIQVDLEVGLVVLNVGDAVELKTVFNLLTRHLMFKLYDFNPGLKYKFDCFFLQCQSSKFSQNKSHFQLLSN